MDIEAAVQGIISFAFDHIVMIIIVILAVILIRIRLIRVLLIGLVVLWIGLSATGVIEMKSPLDTFFSDKIEKEYAFEEYMMIEQEEAFVKINLGGGRIQIKSVEGNQLNVRSQIGDLKISQTKSNGENDILIEEKHIISKEDPLARNTVVALGEEKKWNLLVDSGASELDIDCKNLTLKELSLITGAGYANVYLGNHVEKLYLSGGASNIKIHVPNTLGILVTANGFLNENFEKAGLVKTEVGYQSKDFQEKNGIVHLNVEMGISNLEIVEYE